jgi:CheY-like chemotaxis protein
MQAEARAQAQTKEQEALAYAAGVKLGERKPRVLLVEDDEDMRRLVAAVLRRDGYDVVQVDGGVAMLHSLESAIASDQPDHFDVIVSDIQMPDLTALEVLDTLRDREIPTPVVLMTAYGSDDARTDACALGAFALLDKPLKWDELRAAVRQAVQLR